MINASAFSSCKTMSSCPMEKALKNVLWIIVSFLCGRSTSGQAWPAEPSRHIQSPLFSRCGMRSSSDLLTVLQTWTTGTAAVRHVFSRSAAVRSEEHTSELQSLAYLVCRLLLEKKNKKQKKP